LAAPTTIYLANETPEAVLLVSLISEPPAVIYNDVSFADEKQKIMPASPKVEEVFAIVSRFEFARGFPERSLIDSQKSRHLSVLQDSIWLSEAFHDHCCCVRRMSQLNAHG
jgi:hypothetical protein